MTEKLRLIVRAENIPLVLAIVLSFGFLLYDFFQPSPDVSSRIIIAVLGVLAFGLLAERLGYFERIELSLREMGRERRALFQIPLDWTDFESYCESAKEIFVSGGSLAALVPRYRPLFEEMANNGCKMRFILLNPASPALGAVATWAGAPSERFKSEIEVSLAHLKELVEISGRNVEVRLNSSIPALTIIGFNPMEQDGRIRIDLNLFKSPPARRLYFELTRAPHNTQEEGWYQGFRSQFEKLWTEAEPWADG